MYLTVVIEEAHEAVTTEGYRGTWINRLMTLCQPHQRAEKEPWAILFSSMNE